MQKKYLFWLIFIFILTNTININAQYGRGTKFKEAEIHYEKGQDYLRTKIVVKGETRSKYYEKAISEFKQALYIDPDYTDALFHLGECYYHVGDYKQCITTFQRLHELVNNESTNNWINLRLSLCYEKIGNKEEAEKHSKRIIRNYVSDENPSIETDLTKLKNEISNLKRSHNYNPSIFVGSPIIEKYKHLAMDYAKKGMCGKAVEVHRAMMQEYPQILPYNGSTAEENIMKCYEKIGAWKDLLNIYKESLPDLSHNLNWCLQELYNMNQVLKKYLATEYSNKNISILNKQVPQKWYYEIKDEMLTLSCIYNKKFIDGYFQYANKHLEIGRDTWNTNEGPISRILVKFNFEGLNEGIEIHQAKLFIYPSVGGGNSNVYSLHPITVDWSENEVSWNERLKNIKWYNSGGAFDNKEKYFYSGSEKIRKNIFIFDITPLVKKWLKKKISNYGVILKEPDEDNIFRRTPLRICNKEERLHPRLILICESNINPELEGFLKYEEDWVDLYIQGMDGLLEKDLGKTIAYWTEASKKAGDEQIKSKINEHIKIIADFIQEQRAKTKN